MTTRFFEKFSSDLSNLLLNSDEYNVTIEVGKAPNNQIFKAHSIVLNSRCSYFKNKLSNITYENNIKKINVNISVKVFDIILKYIYSGIISLEKVDISTIFDLLITSIEFGLDELVMNIQSFLIENNASWLHLNFPRIYQSDFNLDNFKVSHQFCTNIIIRYPSIIFNSDRFFPLSENYLIFILKLDYLQIDEILIWDYIIKWGIAQNPSLSPNPDQWSDADISTLKNTLKNCLPLIRYFQISGKDIFDKIRPYQKIFDQNLWDDIETKLMAPNREVIKSAVLPPRNFLPISIPSRTTSMPEFNAFELKQRGESHFVMGRYKHALIDLSKSLEIIPNNSHALTSRGVTYHMLDKYEEALVDLNKSLEIDPNDAFTLRNREV
ncbi:serine-enriched protein [Gigaspora margarita]|uniref:Serine-enriched protein n=1 Tax=Gigaspora margarita TaxID=4874 RepID=A0A8H4APA5_GIGMA|nr:serine-enriched protein [Gigaspora margarita]